MTHYKIFSWTIGFFYTFTIYAQPTTFPNSNKWENQKITVYKASESAVLMHAESIYEERWDDLPQTQFWKQIMLLSPDSCLINCASNRVILEKLPIKQWHSQTESEKAAYKDSLRILYQFPPTEKINVTTGKNDFYKFTDVYPSLSKGVTQFEQENVDPWYAQAILLIESPGQLKKSSVGAYGAFQLMPSVARAQGLIVSGSIDERKDFNRSAQAAAKLLKKVCIPEAKKILSDYHIYPEENSLWFRLFVLHVYHAGSKNVRAVVAKIQPSVGDQTLITQMWQHSAAGFGNNSQNYSQLALSAQIILNELIYATCDEIAN